MGLGIGRKLKKAGRSVSKFAKDPGRVVTAFSTFGASELLRAGMPRMPGVPGMPGTPTMADAAAAGEEERRQASRKGRISTILTGGQGVQSAATLASRALFGPGGSMPMATGAAAAAPAMATPEQQGAAPEAPFQPRRRRRGLTEAATARFGTPQYA